ncbi:MAG: hypothetical protein GX666_03510 [Tissierellia bacterium]|nr:hypothetical protein [Tissierellia bacterium]
MDYSNLKDELERKNLSIEVLSYVLNLHRETVNKKLNGERAFSIAEACTIRETFFPEKTIEYLFYRELEMEK